VIEEALDALLEEVPEAIGAVVCDFEGEAVVSSMGAAPLPREAEERVMEHVPKRIALDVPIGHFLMRLGGAEPCALLRTIDHLGCQRGAGSFRSLHLAYERVEILVDPLPSDYYLVLVLRRPALASHARFHLQRATHRIAEYVG
jgi:hypothetical protein